jgi:3-hydroxyisobutyrate dehydrogenase
MRIGFIGTGTLGTHLAASLLGAGHALAVHDRAPDATRHLIGRGAEWAASGRQAARGADAVITCLPSPGAVDAVMEGDDGVLAGLGAGATWIEMSTNHADAVRRLENGGAIIPH